MKSVNMNVPLSVPHGPIKLSTANISVSWDIMSRRPLKVNRSFEALFTTCFRLVSCLAYSSRPHVLLKRQLTLSGLQEVGREHLINCKLYDLLPYTISGI
jgi:hypothetical protein